MNQDDGGRGGCALPKSDQFVSARLCRYASQIGYELAFRVSLSQTDLFLPSHRRNLRQRKRIANLGHRLMARQTLRLIHAGPFLFGGGERGVVPILIAQHVGDVLAPARVARHRVVEQQLVGHKKTVAAGDRFLVGIEIGGVHFSEQKCAVGRNGGFSRRCVDLFPSHDGVLNLYYSFLISLINLAGECNDDASSDRAYT